MTGKRVATNSTAGNSDRAVQTNPSLGSEPNPPDPWQEQARLALRQMKQTLLAFRGRLDEDLRPRGATAAELVLLHKIGDRPGASGAQLSRACYVTPQTAQTLLVRAEIKGWIRRGKDTENHRLVTWSLTAAGQRLLRTGEIAARSVERQLWNDVSSSDLGQINRILARCLENMAEPKTVDAAPSAKGSRRQPPRKKTP